MLIGHPATSCKFNPMYVYKTDQRQLNLIGRSIVSIVWFGSSFLRFSVNFTLTKKHDQLSKQYLSITQVNAVIKKNSRSKANYA